MLYNVSKLMCLNKNGPDLRCCLKDCVYVYVCAYVYVYIFIYKFTYVYIYLYIWNALPFSNTSCLHTQTHRHTHIHALDNPTTPTITLLHHRCNQTTRRAIYHVTSAFFSPLILSLLVRKCSAWMIRLEALGFKERPYIHDSSQHC